jgi:hypothetical protein
VSPRCRERDPAQATMASWRDLRSAMRDASDDAVRARVVFRETRRPARRAPHPQNHFVRTPSTRTFHDGG